MAAVAEPTEPNQGLTVGTHNIPGRILLRVCLDTVVELDAHVWYSYRPNTNIKKLMIDFSQRIGKELENLFFFTDQGRPIGYFDTPTTVSLGDKDGIVVVEWMNHRVVGCPCVLCS